MPLRGIDDPATMTAAPRGTPIYKATYNNFAPRAGIAYRLRQRQGWETLLRGGLGIFYDLGNGQSAQGLGNTFPFSVINTIPNVPYPLNPTLAAPPALTTNPPFGPVVVFDPHLKLPRTYQWNITAEQSLGSHQTVSASYVAALGRRLLRQEVYSKPNANFNSTVQIVRNSATSDYHGLQLEFQRRLSRGLQALISYTWSHSIDTASDESSRNVPVGKVDPRQDRGSSNFDVRHSFTTAITYNLPAPTLGALGSALLRHWSVDTVFRARSATPLNVVTGADVFGIGVTSTSSVSRPDLVSGVPLYINDPTAPGGKRINNSVDPARPGCKGPFCTPTTARQGSLGRNALRGFPFSQFDFALRRQFNFTERFNLQFRAEFFNLLNHPNFGDPVNTLTSGLFGQSTSMLGKSLGSGGTNGGFNPLYQIGGPRSIEFAVKLGF